MAVKLEMTHEKADEVLNAFNDMIEAIPKRKRADHLFVINEVSLILDTLHRQSKPK